VPSIFEIAKEAGVSASTVSRTFNSPHLINSETRQRVLEVAQRLNYSPLRQRIAREQRTVSTSVVDFHFFAERPEDTLQGNAFYSQVLAGAMAEAADLGVQLTLSSSGRSDLGASLPQSVANGSAAGMLLVGVADPKVVDKFTASSGAVVFVDTHDPTGRHDAIVTDNIGGAEKAVKYLIELGHKRIGFVTGGHEVDSFRERLNGYLSAHYWAGLSCNPTDIVHKDAEAIRACLSHAERPTAFMCANDECAIVVMQACHELGLNIPGDLSLVGFDDVDFSSRTIPPLTSVHVPTDLLGRLAVRRIQAKISEGRETVTLPSFSVVPVRLVERQSCRAIGK
jgi:DNA-binding LacI/PurR family transcriptional regulator